MYVLTYILLLFIVGKCSQGFSVQKGVCESTPPSYKHAIMQEDIRDMEFIVGTVINYDCEFGYELVGNPHVQCISSQGMYVWSRRRFSCNPKSCEDPAIPEYGRIIGCDHTTGSYITFECLVGYAMMTPYGNEQLTEPPFQICSENGTWIGSVPICKEIECTWLEPIANSRMLGTRRTYQSTVYFECEEGYELVGSDVRQCELDGEWSGTQPVCELAYQSDGVVTPDWMWVPPDEPEPEHRSLFQNAVHFGKKVFHLVKSTSCNIMKLFYSVC